MALPSVAITPVTRQRLSPTLNHWPIALFLPKSSDSTSLPITQTGGDRSRVTPGKKLPLSISHFLTAKKEGVVPMIGTDLSKPLNCAGVSPTTIGAILFIASICLKLIASSTVKSLGATPAKSAGEPPPVVSFFPGITISRLVPMSLNSPVM